MSEAEGVVAVKAKPTRRVFAAKKGGARINRIPEEILNDPEIKRDAAVLPQNYNFEIPKTIWKVRDLAFAWLPNIKQSSCRSVV